MSKHLATSRREFLRFLASSPLFGAVGLSACDDDDDHRSSDAVLVQPLLSPEDAINVFDFERAARETVPTSHFGYLATGVDDDGTLRANREGFSRFYLRPRRLVDVSNIDMSVELFGERWETRLSELRMSVSLPREPRDHFYAVPDFIDQ